MADISTSQLRDIYSTHRTTLSDVGHVQDLVKSLIKRNEFTRVDESLSNILNMKPDYGINSMKNRAGSWQNLLKNVDVHTLNCLRLWLREFSIEYANAGNFKEIYLKGDVDDIFSKFKSASLSLHREGYIRVDPKVRFEKEVPIIVSARLGPLLRRVGASYNVDDRLIEISYPRVDTSEVLLFHELCHAYLQSFSTGSFYNKYPKLVEGATELMTLKMLAHHHRKGSHKIPRTDAYYGYSEIIKLLCKRSNRSVTEEDFVWATADKRWLKRLQVKLNMLYAETLNTKDVLTWVHNKLSKRHSSIFSDDYSEMSLEVLAELKTKLTPHPPA